MGGGTLSIKQFLSQEKLQFINVINRLQYDKLINYYCSLVGKENVFVLMYEVFKLQKIKFLKDIYCFLGVEEDFIPDDLDFYLNRSHHPFTIKLDRVINLLFNNSYGVSLFGDRFFKLTLKTRRGYILPIGTIYRRIIIEKFIDPKIMYRYFKTKSFLSIKEKLRLEPAFYKSNKKLGNFLKEDIGKFGYPIE